MKIAEAIKSGFLNLRIDYGCRRLIGNDAGDGFKVTSRSKHARHVLVLYVGGSEENAVAALLGDDEVAALAWQNRTME